jgi:flagellar hook assembly protein FlgD
LVVSISPSAAERVSINITWGSQTFKILDAAPFTAGSYSFSWSGRNPSGKVIDEGALATCTADSLIRENYIITSGDSIKITDVKTDPYSMSFSYGVFTRIKYTIDRDAIVTVTIISPNGSATTVTNNESQTAGAQEITWNGVASSDPSGKTSTIVEEGDYIVQITATNPSTGTISKNQGNIAIWY